MRGVFDLEPREPVTAKGFAQPVAVYRVKGAKERAFRPQRRGVEGVETRMVGRDAELRILQEAYYLVVEDGERQIVTIVGEPGLGKSRLLYEFDNWVDLQPALVLLYRGRARQETRGIPYSLLRDLFAFRFEIHDDDPAAVVRDKMTTGFAATMGTEETTERNAHILGQLIGYDFRGSPYVRPLLDDAQQLRDRGLMYLVDYFKAATAQAPVSLALEDLHWADDGSLNAVTRLGMALEGRPALIISAARPELYQRRPHWFEGLEFHRQLDLHPLSKRESRQLVEDVLQKVDEVPDALRELVVSNAEGNPFYVEELIKMLVEEGVIVKAEPNWRVMSGRLADVRVPPTLTGVLQARLDSLPEQERAVLQQASVVGRVFWDSVVAHLSQGSGIALPNEVVRDGLEMLRAKEMVFHRDISSFAGTSEYIFKHALLRDVAYETVLKRLRKAYHELAAEWLVQESAEQGRTEEYAGLIADHYDLAGSDEEARIWHRQAGEQAATRYSHAEAIRHFSRALELTPEDDPETRSYLLLAREEEYHLQGNRQAQAEDVEALETLAKIRQLPSEQAVAAWWRARLAEATNDYPSAITAAQDTITHAQAAGDMGRQAAGQLLWGRALWRQGGYPNATEHLTAAMSLAQAAALRNVEADSLRNLGALAGNRADYAASQVFSSQSVAIYREIGDRYGEGIAINNLGLAATYVGDYAGAPGLLRAEPGNQSRDREPVWRESHPFQPGLCDFVLGRLRESGGVL